MSTVEERDAAGGFAALSALKFDEDSRTIPRMIAEDEFEDVTIERVVEGGDGWCFLSWGGGITAGFVCPDGVVVKVGDHVRIFGGAGLGGRKHGWALNGEVVEWQTPWERFAKRVEWLASYDREKRERAERDREKWTAAYEGLPGPLKARIDRFVAEHGSFDGFLIDMGGYEMFICAEAAKFAQAARVAVAMWGTHGAVEQFCAVEQFWAMPVAPGHAEGTREEGTVFAVEPSTDEERWLLWAWALNSGAYAYDHERQRRVLGHEEGHSGNTFGGACSLAWALLRGEEV